MYVDLRAPQLLVRPPNFGDGHCPEHYKLHMYRITVLISEQPSWLDTFSFFFFALEFPQTPGPSVPPLNHHAVFVSCYSWPVSLTFAAAHHQVSAAQQDLWALAGQILDVDPQHVVSSFHSVISALVYRKDIDSELCPRSNHLDLQDVHLNHCKKKSHILNRNLKCVLLLGTQIPLVFLSVI